MRKELSQIEEEIREGCHREKAGGGGAERGRKEQ